MRYKEIKKQVPPLPPKKIVKQYLPEITSTKKESNQVMITKDENHDLRLESPNTLSKMEFSIFNLNTFLYFLKKQALNNKIQILPANKTVEDEGGYLPLTELECKLSGRPTFPVQLTNGYISCFWDFWYQVNLIVFDNPNRKIPYFRTGSVFGRSRMYNKFAVKWDDNDYVTFDWINQEKWERQLFSTRNCETQTNLDHVLISHSRLKKLDSTFNVEEYDEKFDLFCQDKAQRKKNEQNLDSDFDYVDNASTEIWYSLKECVSAKNDERYVGVKEEDKIPAKQPSNIQQLRDADMCEDEDQLQRWIWTGLNKIIWQCPLVSQSKWISQLSKADPKKLIVSQMIPQDFLQRATALVIQQLSERCLYIKVEQMPSLNPFELNSIFSIWKYLKRSWLCYFCECGWNLLHDKNCSTEAKNKFWRECFRHAKTFKTPLYQVSMS